MMIPPRFLACLLRQATRWHAPAWLMLIALVAPLLAACGPAAALLKPATIKFAYAPADDPVVQPLAKQYQKDHPNVTVKLMPLDQRQLDNLDPADVDVFVGSNLSLANLLKKNAIINIDPWLESDGSFNRADFLPGSMDLFVDGQKTWAVPAGLDPYVLYYNADLFDKYGAAHPTDGWKWEDFLQAATQLTDPNAGNFGYVSRSMVDPALFIYQHGGKLVNDWQNPTKPTFDDAKAIEALEWWDSLSSILKIAPRIHITGLDTGGRPEQAIFQGHIGMWFGQLSERGGMSWPEQYRWQIKWGMAPLPHDAQAATIATGEGYFISAKTATPDDCWQWVNFLSKHPTARLAPARKSALDSNDYILGAGADVAKTARTALATAMLMPSLENSALARIAAPFQTVVSDVSGDTATVQDAMKKAQEAALSATQ